MSGQPYSDKALAHATLTLAKAEGEDPMDGVTWEHIESEISYHASPLHDREALGLDASVCARTFLNEIVAWLNERERDLNAAPLDWGNVAHKLAAQFGDHP